LTAGASSAQNHGRSTLTPRDYDKESPMAKPNYAFAKRQRELAKKQKKEEKKLRKAAAHESAAPEEAPPQPPTGEAAPS
jgi:hypothetical protein